MAWYYGTYSCGHEGRVNIIGPQKFRQYKIDREFEKVCPNCWEEQLKKEHEKANAEALEKAKEMELPQLTGSEKQVAWANTIRQQFIDKFIENDITKDEYLHIWDTDFRQKVKDIKLIKDIAYWCIENVVKAHEWIDNRECRLTAMIVAYYKETLKTDEEKQQEKAIEEMRTESIVYPGNKITEAVVEISYTKDKIVAKFEKNEDFRLLVKSLGYGWKNGVWERDIPSTAGKVEDRVAELGNKLLNDGFPIMILDEAVRNNAVNGIYEKEHTRWIGYWKKKNLLYISWKGYSDSLYKTAKSLPGAYWDTGDMVLKVSHYKEVEDFANLYNFKFTQKALEVIEEYKKETEKISVVNPVEVKEEQQQDNQLQDILKSSSDILDDLKDD